MSRTTTIAMILRSVAGLVQMPELSGLKAAKLAPLIDTAAALAEVPEALEGDRQALLSQVQRWIDEKRAPTDEELDTFKVTRDDLDQRIREARAALP
jgi:hypothetical protein